MSLYNLVHGENPYSSVLLAMLGLNRANVPRYRDCWFDDGKICVHTRTGGGNRDYYESEDRCRENYPEYFQNDEPPTGPWNKDLRALPTFSYDEDDDYDSTYATFYFNVPEKLQWVVPHLQEQSKTPAERWQGFMNKMRDPAQADDPQIQRALGAMAPIFEQITQHFNEQQKL